MKYQNSFLHIVLLSLLYIGLLTFAVIGCDDKDIIVDPWDPMPAGTAVAAWSPDGEWIAISRYGPGLCGLFMVKPDGTDFRHILSSDSIGFIIDICWSPNGEWIACNAGHEIYKVKPDGDGLIRLTYNGSNNHCSWSSSDSLIAYDHSSGDSSGVWIMRSNGANQTPFIRHGGHFDFGNYDSLFYIISIGQAHAKLAIINIADSAERFICEIVAGQPYLTYYSPSVSPDGQTIAFCIDGEIRTMSAVDGSNVQTLTSGGGKYPDWSPDGQYIVYCKPTIDPGGGTVWIMNADGTEKHVLVDNWGEEE